MRMKRWLYVALGYVGLVLGIVGALIPFIPTVPFLLVAALGFARGSARMNAWFVGTRLYREHLEGYVAGRGMTRRAKRRLLSALTLVMGIGFLMMGAVPIARMVLLGVWVAHVVYVYAVVPLRES